MREIKIYLRWYLGGRFFLDEHDVLVEDYVLPPQWPARAVQAQFFTQEVLGELKGPMKPASPLYIKGTIYTLEQVEAQFPDKDTLIWNMKNNNIDRVYKTSTGQFGVVEKDMVLV